MAAPQALSPALTPAGRRLWRLLIWGLGLSPPLLASLKPRSFAGDLNDKGVLIYLAPRLLSFFFISLAMIAFKRHVNRRDPKKKQGLALAFMVLTILLAAMPILSSLVVGSNAEWSKIGLIGIIGLYLAAYFLPSPSPKWWGCEVRKMLLTVFIYGSLVAAVVAPSWAWNNEYNLEASVTLFPMRLFGTANHANALAPIAVFTWLLGRFPGCRIKGEHLHSIAILLVVILAQSKTIWGISLFLIGIHILLRISRLSRLKKYFTYFCLGTTTFIAVEYLVTCSHYASKISDIINDPQVLTLTGRLPLWLYAVQMWLERPLLGVGLDAWSSKLAKENVLDLGWDAPHAHNQLLQVLSEGGLVGMGALVIWGICYFLIARKSPDNLRRPLWWLTAFLVLRGFTEVNLRFLIGADDTMLTWLLFCLVLIIGAWDQKGTVRYGC